jgi:hypothetical protein
MAGPRCLLFCVALLVSRLIVAADMDSATFGDWFVGTTEDKTGVFAATINDSGGLLGEYCFFKTGKC